MEKNILIVKQDLKTLYFFKNGLEKNGCENIYLANNFDDSVKICNEINIDMVITDFLLEGVKDGIHLAEYLQIRKCPFIFHLSKKNKEAEEYIKNEFQLDILYEEDCFLNLISILNDSSFNNSQNETSDFDIKRIKEKYSLTKNEAKCLEILYMKNSILSHIQLQAELWPNKNRCEATLRSLVRRVRDKFGEEIIESIYGLGYKVNVKKESLLT